MTECSQRMYLLKCLEAKGLPISKLRNIMLDSIISRIMYAIPAWSGFLTAKFKTRIDGLLRRLYRYNYTLLYIEQMLREADEVLFHEVLKTEHSLSPYET